MILGQRYKAMELGQALLECSTRDSLCSTTCGVCYMTVILHCSDCKIQVTGCRCTARDRGLKIFDQ